MTEPLHHFDPPLDDAFFRAMVEESVDVVTVIDGDAITRYLSPGFTALFELDREVVLGVPVLDFIHPDDRARIAEALGRVMAGEVASERVETRFVHGAGGWRHIEAVGRRWEHHGRTYTLINTRDIDERVELRRQLERSNELLSTMLHATRDLMSVTELETGRIVEVNEAWSELSGFSREESIGRTAYELGTWGDPGNRDRLVADVRAAGGRLQDYEITTYTRHKGPRQLLVNVEPLSITEDEAPLILMAAVDRTDANLTEAKLRQAQRMEAVGQLTGGLAHDFNNLLGIILGNGDLLLEALEGRPDARELVELVIHAAERGAAVTRQLLAFARKQTLDPSALRVDESMRGMLPLFRTTCGAAIEVALEIAPDLPPAFVDEGEVEAAVLNLVVNARDAMPDGGRLDIRVGLSRVAPGEVSGGEELAPGEYLAVSVEDTGSGMDPETAARVFEPFFTTKATGRGTGLGLSMVFGFARQSGGHVRVRSERGVGTCMTLLLPPTGVPAADAEETVATTAPPARGERVLLLEDEPDLLRLLRRMLEHIGYEVLEAGDEQALDRLMASGVEFDLLLSDVQLTGALRGPELAARVVGQRPSVRVLFMTGFADESLMAVQEQPLRVLHKPFGRDQLAEAVRDALDD